MTGRGVPGSPMGTMQGLRHAAVATRAHFSSGAIRFMPRPSTTRPRTRCSGTSPVMWRTNRSSRRRGATCAPKPSTAYGVPSRSSPSQLRIRPPGTCATTCASAGDRLKREASHRPNGLPPIPTAPGERDCRTWASAPSKCSTRSAIACTSPMSRSGPTASIGCCPSTGTMWTSAGSTPVSAAM